MGRKHKAEEEPATAMASPVTAKKSKPAIKARKKHHSDSEDSDIGLPKGGCF